MYWDLKNELYLCPDEVERKSTRDNWTKEFINIFYDPDPKGKKKLWVQIRTCTDKSTNVDLMIEFYPYITNISVRLQ